MPEEGQFEKPDPIPQEEEAGDEIDWN